MKFMIGVKHPCHFHAYYHVSIEGHTSAPHYHVNKKKNNFKNKNYPMALDNKQNKWNEMKPLFYSVGGSWEIINDYSICLNI